MKCYNRHILTCKKVNRSYNSQVSWSDVTGISFFESEFLDMEYASSEPLNIIVRVIRGKFGKLAKDPWYAYES